MDTLRRLSVKLTNPGKAHVNYSWAWLQQDATTSGAAQLLDSPEPSSVTLVGAATAVGGTANRAASTLGSASRFGGGSVGAASSKAAPPQLFDVLPIRGCLGPGESETAEVSFYGYPGVKATAMAVCHVADGPDYQVGWAACWSEGQEEWGIGGSVCCRRL